MEYPIFSIATASTPVWLKENLKKGDATSGFMARFLFAFQNKKVKSIPIPILPDEDKVEKLNSVFSRIYKLEPNVIELDSEFEKIYRDFYYESDELIEDLDVDNGLKSIFSRLQTDYFLKFTILECVLSEKTTASKEEALRAKYLVAFYMAQAITTIKNISPNEQMGLEKKIMKIINGKREVTKTDLYRSLHNNISAQRLNSALSSLEKAGLVVYDVSISGDKTKIYRLIS